MRKLSDYVMDFLAAKGITNVFLLPGGGAMHLDDSLGRHKNLEYTCFLHEQALAITVEAWGQHTNRPGVGLVTSGPGSTSGSQSAGGSGNAAAGSSGQSSGPGSETGTPGVSQSSPGETTAAGLAGASGTGQPATATRPVETGSTGTTASVETAAPAPAETTAAQASSRKKGDCNGDGTVSILDVMLIRQHVLGQKQLSGDAAAAADVNGDGAITSADADALQSQILGG